MLLAQMAIYLFLLVFVLYLAYRALWIVFFLFAFRFWDMILTKFMAEAISTLSPMQKFLLLVILAVITYLSVVLTTIKMPVLRYVFLAILVIAAVRVYTVADILFFKDYLVEGGMWSWEYWGNQLRKVFSLKPDQIIGIFEKAIGTFTGLFTKLVDIIRGI